MQVTQDVCEILERRGYVLECRGQVKVKGKGDMLIYVLHEKSAPLSPPSSSPASSAAVTDAWTVDC